MDSDREERERAIQEADRLQAEFERDELQRAQRLQRQRQAGELVYKTYEPQSVQQQEQIADLSPAVQKHWDDWADARIAKFMHDVVMDATAEFVSEYVFQRLKEETTKLRNEFAEQLGQLRADMSIQVGVAKGEITQIKGKADAA